MSAICLNKSKFIHAYGPEKKSINNANKQQLILN